MKHLLLLNGHPAKDGFSMDIIDRYESYGQGKRPCDGAFRAWKYGL